MTEDAGRTHVASRETLEENKRRLLQEMKQTKGSRFNAASRLEERDRSRTRLIAYASASVLVLTILPSFLPVPDLVVRTIGLSTVAFSLVILAASLLQSSNADPVKAVKLHSCALEVNSLLREFRADPLLSADSIKAYSARYDAILMRHGVNHDQIDYERYKLEHPDEFPEMEPSFEKAGAKEVIASTIAERGARIIGATAVTLALFAVASSVPAIAELLARILGP